MGNNNTGFAQGWKGFAVTNAGFQSPHQITGWHGVKSVKEVMVGNGNGNHPSKQKPEPEEEEWEDED